MTALVYALSAVEASGGHMAGCQGGRWAMGVPYATNATTFASGLQGQTIARGVYASQVYDTIRAVEQDVNEHVGTPAACATIVRRDHPSANAALYSNVGEEGCRAVFDA